MSTPLIVRALACVGSLAAMLDPSQGQDDRVGRRELEVQRKQLEARLAAGDLQVIRGLNTPVSFGLLYDMLMLCMHNQFPGNTEVKAVVINQLASIHGHAHFIGDEVDNLTAMPGTTLQREKRMVLLKEVGSKEALEELGRLLFDSRLAEAEALPGELDSSLAIKANDSIAAESLHTLLGSRSPLNRRPSRLPNGVALMRQWWLSPTELLLAKSLRLSLEVRPCQAEPLQTARVFRKQSLKRSGVRAYHRHCWLRRTMLRRNPVVVKASPGF